MGATKCAGDNHTSTVTNTGVANFQWQKGGVNLVDKAGSISGATTKTLTNLSAIADPGNYVLVATGTGAYPVAGYTYVPGPTFIF